MDIKGFKKISYEELQTELHKRSTDNKIHDINVAAAIDVKSINTIRNAFNTERQVVSDEVLTNVMNEFGMAAAIVWINGERNYFLSLKN